MLFSVIIPTYNDWDRLQVCLDGLRKQKVQPDEFEIIVVNNAETNHIPEQIKLPDNATILHEPKPGSYAARNRGAEAAKGKILAFTDSDCIPESNWLKNAEKQFESQNCDLIGGRVEFFREKDGSKLLYVYEKQYLFRQQENTKKGVSVTANLFVRKEAFDKTGGFDETVKSMGDVEFTRRCTSQGYRIAYGQDVTVRHPSRKTLKAFLKRRYRITCWKEILTHGNTAGRYRRFRSLLIKFIIGLKKFIKRKSNNGRWTDTVIIKYVTLVELCFETGVRFAILSGYVDPYSARE